MRIFICLLLSFTYEAYIKLGVHYFAKDVPNEMFKATWSGQRSLPGMSDLASSVHGVRFSSDSFIIVVVVLIAE